MMPLSYLAETIEAVIQRADDTVHFGWTLGRRNAGRQLARAAHADGLYFFQTLFLTRKLRRHF